MHPNSTHLPVGSILNISKGKRDNYTGYGGASLQPQHSQVGAEESRVQGQWQARLGYIIRPCIKNNLIFLIMKKEIRKPSTVVPAYNPRSLEAEA